jgi:hypothetical protein
MNRIKKWFMNVTFDFYILILFALGALLWMVNLLYPDSLGVYVIGYTMCALIIFSVGEMIYKLIKGWVKK